MKKDSITKQRKGTESSQREEFKEQQFSSFFLALSRDPVQGGLRLSDSFVDRNCSVINYSRDMCGVPILCHTPYDTLTLENKGTERAPSLVKGDRKQAFKHINTQDNFR